MEPQKQRQYLAELVTAREYEKKTGSKPPLNFWNIPVWKKRFKLQIIEANSLLKIFEFQDIVDALTDKSGSWIYSLKFPGLIDLIQIKKNIRETKAKAKEAFPTKPEIPNNPNEQTKVSKPFSNKKSFNIGDYE